MRARCAGPTTRGVAVALRGAGPLVSLAVLGALVWSLPRITGTSWSGVMDVLGRLSIGTLLLLALVWTLSMLAHTWVQTGALPGLSRGRALLVNVSSSAVASTLPAGGPLSVAINWRMLASWGFSSAEAATYTTVTTVTTAAAKLGVPLLAVVAVVAAGGTLPPGAARVGLVAAAAAGVATGAVASLLWAVSRRTGRQLLPRSRVVALGVTAVRDIRRGCADVVRRCWPSLAGGAVAQLSLQLLLLLLCLRATGVHLEAPPLLVAFGVGRLASVVPVTPGGLGVTETATSALLIAGGVDPAAAVSSSLLYSLLSVLLEIPLGAVGLLWWRLSLRRGSAFRSA